MKNAVDLIIDYESGLLNEDETVIMFQELIDSELIWVLQGHYGRTAHGLIEQGYCHWPEGGAE